MSRPTVTLIVILLFACSLLAQQQPDQPATSTPPARRSTTGGPFGSGRSAFSSRAETPADLGATGKLVALDVLIAAPAEVLAAPTAAKILELEKSGKLQSAVRLHLAALENQSTRVQFGELVARVTGRTMSRPGQSMPNYTDVNVGTMAQAISRVSEDGFVVTQLTIERSGVAAVPAREGAADDTITDPPPAVFTLTTLTTVRLKPGEPLVIVGGQTSSKQAGQTWIVVTASVSSDGPAAKGDAPATK